MSGTSLGWAGRVMDWLAFPARLVLVNVLFVAGSFAGLVFLGVFPAAVAAATVLARLRTGENDRLVGDFVTVYRARFLHANKVGSVFWAAGVVLALNVATVPAGASPVHAVLLLLSMGAGAVALAAAATAVTLCSRCRDSARNIWKTAFVLPLVSPGLGLSLLGSTAGIAVVFLAVPVLVPLAGASIPLLACGAIVGHRLDRQRNQCPLSVEASSAPTAA